MMLGVMLRVTAQTVFMVVLLTTATAIGQGVNLRQDRNVIFKGEQDRFDQIVCQADGNGAILHSVTVIWVKVTGETIDLLTISEDQPMNNLSKYGMTGHGILQNNNGYILLDKIDAPFCEHSYFLCEVTFTKSSGTKMERAITMARPCNGHSQDGDSGQNAQDLAALEKEVATMSAALEAFNTSYMQNRDQESLVQAEILARLSKLENRLSCDSCLNAAQMIEDIKRRLKTLENSITGSVAGQANTNGTDQESKPVHVVCERGMNESVVTDFVLVEDISIGKTFRCDAQTDGGGWVVFQRRASGDVDFKRSWAEYRDGFGDLVGDFWLGNEALYVLTSQDLYQLRIEFTSASDSDSKQYHAEYSSFRILNEDNSYRLVLGPYTTGSTNQTSNTGFASHKSSDFSTFDRPNDNSIINSICADVGGCGGWWFSNCNVTANLNGAWFGSDNNTSMFWVAEDKTYYPSFVEMKMRRRSSLLNRVGPGLPQISASEDNFLNANFLG